MGTEGTGLSPFDWASLTYAALAFIKTMLCYTNIFTAAGVLSRKLGNRSVMAYCIVLLIITPFIVFFSIPKTLLRERFSFFLVYSTRKVIRDILIAI